MLTFTFLNSFSSVLVPPYGISKNMSWTPSATIWRRAFNFNSTSIFYTFPVFDHFITSKRVPVLNGLTKPCGAFEQFYTYLLFHPQNKIMDQSNTYIYCTLDHPISFIFFYFLTNFIVKFLTFYLHDIVALWSGYELI